jgi:voltage-gated potassium channel
MRNSWLATTGRRVLVLIVLSLLLVAFGTFGYIAVEGFSFLEGLYMTVITLSTVGFTEVRPLDDIGRVFTMVLILMGVGFIAYNLAYFSQVLLDGNLQEIYRRRKLGKKLDQLEKHYIICGYGQMGQIISEELQKFRVPLVVIENDELALQRLREKDILHLTGDATDEENLAAAGIERALGLVAVVSKDSENVFIVLTARDLKKDLRIFARASSPGTDKRLLKAGADRVVSPFAIGAARIAHNILRPTVTDLLDLAMSAEGMELSLEEVVIPADSYLAGTELLNSGMRNTYNLIVIGIKRADGAMIYNPAPHELLQAGDTLIVVGPVDNLARFGQDLLGCEFPSPRPGTC